MADRRSNVHRRDRLRRPVASVLGRGQGNAFVPWANIELSSCAYVVKANQPRTNNEAYPQHSPRLVPAEELSATSNKFVPSVRETFSDEIYQSSWIPPLHGGNILYLYKHHQIKVEPLTSVFSGKAFPYVVLRNALAQLGPFIESWQKQLEASRREDSDDEDEISEQLTEPPPNLEEQWQKCYLGIMRELAVGATKKVLAFWAAEHLEMRLAWKLTKDLPSSAVRKSKRGLGRLLTSRRMFATASRGYLLFLGASWLVQFAIDAYQCSNYEDLREALRVLAKRTKRNTLRSMVSLVAYALGTAVGTFLLPGKGTLIGSLAGPLAGEAALPFVEMMVKSFGADRPGNGLDFAPL